MSRPTRTPLRPRPLLSPLLLGPLLLGLGACAVPGFRRAPVAVVHPQHETASGVVWFDLLTGLGEGARPGDTLTVNLEAAVVGEFEPFHRSQDVGLPEVFVLGAGEAPLPGLDEALVGQAPGGQRRVILPPEQAYGAEGVPGLVPPDATVELTVELVELERPGAPPASRPEEAAAPRAADDPGPPSADGTAPDPEG